MKYPMLEKHIDEIVNGNWFIFGEHKDGTVDVASASGDEFTHLTKEQAEKIVAIRDKFLNDLYKVIGFNFIGIDKGKVGGDKSIVAREVDGKLYVNEYEPFNERG